MMYAPRWMIMASVAGCILMYGASNAHTEQLILFQDNFEATTVGDPPRDPQVGHSVTTDDSEVVAAGGAHPNAPAAGDQILRTTPGNRNFGHFIETASDGPMFFEMDARLDEGSQLHFGMFGNSTGGVTLSGRDMTIFMRLDADGSVYAFDGETPWADTGLTHTIGEWQRYRIEYELGAEDFTLTVGNSAPTTVPYLTGSPATEMDGLLFGQGAANNTIGYTDNVVAGIVPEPASLALLGLGSLYMINRRRANR